MTNRDLLTRLADAGEEAIARMAETPGAERLIGAVTGLRDRVDELQRRVRGIEELERRVAALEARFAEPPVPTSAPAEAAGMTATAPPPAVTPPDATNTAASSSSTGPDSPG